MNWTHNWIKNDIEHRNVGIQQVINPYLYPALNSAITQSSQPVTVVDFGCGTNSMGFDCITNNELSPRIHKWIGLEYETDLIAVNTQLSYDNRIVTRHVDLSQPLPTHIRAEVAAPMIATSRQFIMHLDTDQLSQHLGEVKDLLEQHAGTSYVLSFLNPEYEQLRHETEQGSTLIDNQPYDFVFADNKDTTRHYYKSMKTIRSLFEKYFTKIEYIPCVPTTDTYRTSHARYYQPNTPMSYVCIASL